MTRREDLKQIRVGRVRVHAVALESLMLLLDDMAGDTRSNYVCFCEAHLCVQAARDPEIRAILEGASLVLPDGVSMTAGARLLGQRFPARLPGPTVMLEYLKHGLPLGRRHFFFGGGEGVAQRLAGRLTEQLPGLVVAGTCTPPFRPMTEQEFSGLKRQVEDSGAEALWVGLGAPKQERWMAENAGRIRVPLMLGVGAAFDFHSGNRKWAPRWIRRIGMEWIYRMVTGGRRVMFRNLRYESAFTWMILKQAAARRLGLGKSKG